MTDAFHARLAETTAATDAMLDRLLVAEPQRGEIARPARLLEAMRYAVLGPGKRLRPFLLIETARIFGRADEGVVRAAAAVECVHAYSLVHDDLPAVDDDDLRRGRSTVHRAYGEALAILAGDALLTLAFDILADPAVDPEPLTCAALVGALARAAGLGGMVGGQALDLEGEAGDFDEDAILRLEAMKTGTLFRYAAQAGAFLGHALEAERHRMIAFGEKFGLAYQLADDLIDATAPAATAGKATNKDAARGKATLIGLYGVEQAKTMVGVAAAEAAALLEPFGAEAELLADAARFIAGRED